MTNSEKLSVTSRYPMIVSETAVQITQIAVGSQSLKAAKTAVSKVSKPMENQGK